MRATIGLRRGLHVRSADGSTLVYYKELSPDRLGRALSRRGPGFKDFRVTFADGSKQLIRCSAEQCFADLMGADGLHRYARFAELASPGARVLDIARRFMSTGYSGAYLAQLVGDAGGVVCLLNDTKAAAFAVKRYPVARGLNLSLECVDAPGTLELNLAGETDGAFNTVIAFEPEGMPAASLVRELARVLAPGGHLVLGRTPELNALHPEFLDALGLDCLETADDERVFRKRALADQSDE